MLSREKEVSGGQQSQGRADGNGGNPHPPSDPGLVLDVTEVAFSSPARLRLMRTQSDAKKHPKRCTYLAPARPSL